VITSSSASQLRDVLAALAGLVLGGAVEPQAGELPALAVGLGRGGTGPLLGGLHEALLAALGEQVAQAGALFLGLVADDHRAVAPAPELLAPPVQAPGLAGDLRVDVVHEAGELPGVSGLEEEVAVIAQVDETADDHPVALLGLGEGADDDGVEVAAGEQEEAPVDGAAGDLDEGIGRDVAGIACRGLRAMRCKTEVEPCVLQEPAGHLKRRLG